MIPFPHPQVSPHLTRRRRSPAIDSFAGVRLHSPPAALPSPLPPVAADTVTPTLPPDRCQTRRGRYSRARVTMSTAAGNIVAEWLRSLRLGQYAESFIDNGYDDLEICKQVGDPDLDAIGVLNPAHRSRLLQSVRTLREEGAASVYFTLEEGPVVQDPQECFCDNVSARSSRTTSSGRSEKEASPAATASSSAESGQEVVGGGRYADEYEEGKAELVKIPRVQLKMLLREKLAKDGVRLSCQPYSTPVRAMTGTTWLVVSVCLYLAGPIVLELGPYEILLMLQNDFDIP